MKLIVKKITKLMNVNNLKKPDTEHIKPGEYDVKMTDNPFLSNVKDPFILIESMSLGAAKKFIQEEKDIFELIL